jgi:hypothetical protein
MTASNILTQIGNGVTMSELSAWVEQIIEDGVFQNYESSQTLDRSHLVQVCHAKKWSKLEHYFSRQVANVHVKVYSSTCGHPFMDCLARANLFCFLRLRANDCVMFCTQMDTMISPRKTE